MMTEWEKETIEKIRKVLKHGWGEVKITISADGRRKNVFYGFGDVSQEKPLHKYIKGV